MDIFLSHLEIFIHMTLDYIPGGVTTRMCIFYLILVGVPPEYMFSAMCWGPHQYMLSESEFRREPRHIYV